MSTVVVALTGDRWLVSKLRLPWRSCRSRPRVRPRARYRQASISVGGTHRLHSHGCLSAALDAVTTSGSADPGIACFAIAAKQRPGVSRSAPVRREVSAIAVYIYNPAGKKIIRVDGSEPNLPGKAGAGWDPAAAAWTSKTTFYSVTYPHDPPPKPGIQTYEPSSNWGCGKLSNLGWQVKSVDSPP